MKIVLLSTDFKPNLGGIAEVAWQLSRNWALQGQKVHAVVNQMPGLASEESPAPALTVHRVIEPITPDYMRGLGRWMKLPQWDRKNGRNLNDLLDRVCPDAVFASNYFRFWRPWLKNRKEPSFAFLHGEDVASGLNHWWPGRRAFVREYVRNTRWIYVNSRYTSDIIRQGTGAANVTPVGCGCTLPEELEVPTRLEARERLGWGGEKVILTVARMIRRKGVDIVLRAMPDILSKWPDCRYVVGGTGSEEQEFRKLAKEYKLQNSVQFLGRISEETKTDVYAASDLFVMPCRGNNSLVEGFGIAFLEANAHGLAVVGTNVGGIPDAVENNVNGLLVQQENPKMLAGAISGLLGDEAARKRMAQAGQQRVRTRFNWPHIARLILEDLMEKI